MLQLGTIDHGLGEQLWCCKCEDVTQKYNATIHSAHNDIPDLLWYGRRPSAWEFRTFGCKIEARINTHFKKLDERTEPGYYLGTTSTKLVIRYCLPDGLPSPGSSITHKQPSPKYPPTIMINTTDHPLCGSDPVILTIVLPPQNTIMRLTIKEWGYHNAPYIQTSSYRSIFQKQVPQEYIHNIWILAIGNNNPMKEKKQSKTSETFNWKTQYLHRSR